MTTVPSLPSEPSSANGPTCTAFLGIHRVAWGLVSDLDRLLAGVDRQTEPLLVFDDATGALIDAPPPPEHAAKLPSAPRESAPRRPQTAAVGRPRLGVVAREVTLLPRHWEWLSAQPGGASAALRRLVDDARRTHASRDAQRIGKERTYRVMSALAGHQPGFEEASRALFGHDAPAFADRIETWPPDVRAHLSWLARDAFDPVEEGRAA